jgi:hypothetical protein
MFFLLKFAHFPLAKKNAGGSIILAKETAMIAKCILSEWKRDVKQKFA